MTAPPYDNQTRAGQPTTTGGHLSFGDADQSRPVIPFHTLEVPMSTHKDKALAKMDNALAITLLGLAERARYHLNAMTACAGNAPNYIWHNDEAAKFFSLIHETLKDSVLEGQ